MTLLEAREPFMLKTAAKRVRLLAATSPGTISHLVRAGAAPKLTALIHSGADSGDQLLFGGSWDSLRYFLESLRAPVPERLVRLHSLDEFDGLGAAFGYLYQLVAVYWHGQVT